MNINDLKIELHQQIEHAPKPGVIASGLLGWWLPVETDSISGDVFLCSKCASRIIGRGFSVPKGGVPAWQTDTSKITGRCICCETE